MDCKTIIIIMKKLLLIALLGFNIAQAQSPVNATYARVRDSLTSYTQNTNLLLKGRGTGKIKLNENAYNIVIASDSSLVAVIQRYSDNVTFGTSGQVPHMNTGGTDFDYSANFTYDGSLATIDNIVIDGYRIFGDATEKRLGLIARNTASTSQINLYSGDFATSIRGGDIIVQLGDATSANSEEFIINNAGGVAEAIMDFSGNWDFEANSLSDIGSLDVDNISINGNTITTTNTGGDLTIDALLGPINILKALKLSGNITTTGTGLSISDDNTNGGAEYLSLGGFTSNVVTLSSMNTGNGMKLNLFDDDSIAITRGAVSGPRKLKYINSTDTWSTASTFELFKQTNQIKLGSTNQATINYPEASAAGDITLTLPVVTSTLYGTGSGTITSSEMATSLSDETGSGALVFGTSPTFTTSLTSPEIYGSSSASGNLTIGSTSNATKGFVYFGSSTLSAFDGTNNRWLIGNTTARTNINSISPALQIEGSSSGSTTAMSLFRNSTTASQGPVFYFGRSNSSTIGSNTAVTDGQRLGTVAFAGTDGTNVTIAGSIVFDAQGTVSSGVVPGKMSFRTANTSGTNTEAQSIDNAQKIYMVPTASNTTASAANFFIDSSTGELKRSTSSRKYKDEIKTLNVSDSIYNLLRPVTYKSKGDSINSYFGYVAEEVDSIGLAPLVVYKDGLPDALQYGQFTALNTLMIQRLMAKIEELESRIEALEAQ